MLARRVGIHVGVFLAGALIAFVYSYAPLHSAKNWKIDYLEERLDASRLQIEDLERNLADVQKKMRTRADPEAFRLLQGELAVTDDTIGDLESKLARSQRRVKDLERSRDSWKAKHSEAELKREALLSEIESINSPAPEVEFPLLPAAPAPGAEEDTPHAELAE